MLGQIISEKKCHQCALVSKTVMITWKRKRMTFFWPSFFLVPSTVRWTLHLMSEYLAWVCAFAGAEACDSKTTCLFFWALLFHLVNGCNNTCPVHELQSHRIESSIDQVNKWDIWCWRVGHECLPNFLIYPRMTCPGNGATHRLSLPTSINNQNDPPQTCPQADMIWLVLQSRLLSQLTIDCVKLTVKTN